MSLKFNALVATKLEMPPARSGWVERDRLLTRLNDGLNRKLTLISAPAGFGKTVLLVQWLTSLAGKATRNNTHEPRKDAETADYQRDVRFSWLSLDKADSDPERFLAYFSAALDKLAPELVLDRIFSAMSKSPRPAPLEQILTTLINELTKITEPLVLVMDDFQSISSEQVHELIGFFLANMPTSIHLIIAARSDPPLQLSRLRVQDQLVKITSRDLKFTSSEAAALLDTAGPQILSAEEMKVISDRMEGWIGGIQLAATSIQEGNRFENIVSSIGGDDRYIRDFLTEEVFSKQLEQDQSFLLRTSILEKLCAPLCTAVTGVDDAQKILERLESKNVLITALDNQRLWYRYHQVFSEYLRTQLTSELPDSVRSLHRKAALWWASDSVTAEAIDHFLQADDFNTAAASIRREAYEKLTRGEVLTLIRWIRSIPEELTHKDPELSLYLTWSLVISGETNWSGAAKLIDHLDALYDAEEEGIFQKLARQTFDRNYRQQLCLLAQLHAFQLRNEGHWDDARDLFKLVVEKSSKDPFITTVSSGGLGSIYLRHGMVAAAENTFGEISSAAKEIDSPYISVIGKTLQAQMQVEQARLVLAAETYKSALSVFSSFDDKTLPFSGQAAVGLGEIHYEKNDLDFALALVNRGIESGSIIKDSDTLISGYYTLAKIYNAVGDYDSSNDAIDKATEVGLWAGFPNCKEASAAYLANFQFIRGNLEPAVQWLSEYRRDLRPIRHEDLVTESPQLFLYFRLLTVQGKEKEAIEKMRPLIENAEAYSRFRVLLTILLIQARAFHSLGFRKETTQSLTRALLIGEPGGFIRSFIDEGPALLSLLSQPAVYGQFSTYVKNILNSAKFDLPSSQQYEPLTERELQVLQLAASGRSNSDISNELYISVSTVKTHINRIYSKLGVHSRVQAITLAREYHIIS